MIAQSNQECMEAIPPEVISEEDAPFDTDKDSHDPNCPNETGDILLAQETPTKSGLDFQRFKLGSSILGWCLFLMTLCILLSIWKPNNELVKNGFEAFKLIVMTILGYLFASNNAKTD